MDQRNEQHLTVFSSNKSFSKKLTIINESYFCILLLFGRKKTLLSTGHLLGCANRNFKNKSSFFRGILFLKKDIIIIITLIIITKNGENYHGILLLLLFWLDTGLLK